MVENDWQLRYPPEMLLIDIMLYLPVVESRRRLGINQSLEHGHILFVDLVIDISTLSSALI